MNKKISITIDELLHKRLKERAKGNNVSINKYLTKLINNDVENKLFNEKNELDKILNILYLQQSKINFIQKILLQHFANTGFARNEDVYDDECIRELFNSNKISFYD
ncbi:MAG: toxin-antitoxin system HicB family antitoxin [bacterium]|nr:toxin-antitoxin system HicB family antitoxin [bacterium]